MDYKLKSGRILRVEHGQITESPRDWDNMGTMICSHGNYHLGDKQVEGNLAQLLTVASALGILDYIIGIDEDYQYDEQKMEEFIRAKKEAVAIKLYIHDHSTVSMHMHQPSCRWDSSHVGWIYVSEYDIIKEYGDCSPESVEKARKVLEGEVETYSLYLQGEVYDYEIIEQETCDLGHVHEKVVDSCGGFYGSDIKTNGIMDYVNDELLEEELV